MARKKPMMMESPIDMPMEPMKADCIPCLEDAGLWYFAQKVRNGDMVYEYEVKHAIDAHGRGEHYDHGNHPGVVGPIRNSAQTNSLAAMMSEGCPPNTGRDYEEV
jgi:hypothetical protein